MLTRNETHLVILSTCLKCLLIPAYRSTDFDVHRNWLRITAHLPLKEWYYDNVSEWTLDYPPFFAYFERILSMFANLVDPVIASRSDETSWSTIVFQRSSVIITELVLFLVLLKFARSTFFKDPQTAFWATATLFLHPGLVIVDHVHFQYNGMLFGILLFSFYAIHTESYRLAAFYFATLLNFKHIFVYIAPPYLIYLFRMFCIQKGQFQLHQFVQLGMIVAGVCALSFGPFLAASSVPGIQQIFHRLFPFQRGLNHAYWAANVWSLYTAADRVLVKVALQRGWSVDMDALSSASRGLVGDTKFGVLPDIPPSTCFAITIALNVIYMTKLFTCRQPTSRTFIQAVTLSAYISFLFGWHVHEKAALIFLVPLTLLASDDYDTYATFSVASAAGVYALLPLMIESNEQVFAITYGLLWYMITTATLRRTLYRPLPGIGAIIRDKLECLYVAGFVLVAVYTAFVHALLFPAPTLDKDTSSMQFLPLMITSCYCALGIIWTWTRLSVKYLLQ